MKRTDPEPSAIDTYFGETAHPASSIWLGFSANYKAAALAHATRQITVFCNGTIPTEEVGGETVVVQRFQYAVFEQALHVAKNSGAALDFDQNRPAFIPPDAGDKANESGNASEGNPNAICAAALAWMNGMGGGGAPRRAFGEIVRG